MKLLILLLISQITFGQSVCPTLEGAVSEKVEKVILDAPPNYNSRPGATNCIYFDFDGHQNTSNSWAIGYCEPSGMVTEQMTGALIRTTEDYSPFDVTITSMESVFNSYPQSKKVRIVVTTTSFYGNSTGVAFVNTFGTTTQGFVFSNLTQYSPKYTGEAMSHESGHTVGLYHQAQWSDQCTFLASYHLGYGAQIGQPGGEIGWAPIMGNAYYRAKTTWHNGTINASCQTFQDDMQIIGTRLGFSSGTVVPKTYPVNITQPSLVTVRSISGGNTDLKITINGVQSSIPDSLNANFSGTYTSPISVLISGEDNEWSPGTPDYGNVGQEFTTITITPLITTPISDTRYVYDRTRTTSFHYTQETIYLKEDIGGYYKLMNTLGQTLIKGNYHSGTNEVSIRNLKSGIYFLQTYFNTYKIIKQ